MYRGPVARADIDYIRGVNCTFILRNLQIRGLVKRTQNPDNARSYLYEATPELLKHLGVASIEELPKYTEMKEEITKFEKERKAEEEESDTELPGKTEI